MNRRTERAFNFGGPKHVGIHKQLMAMLHLEELMKLIVVSAYLDHHDLARNKNTQGATWDTQFTVC